MEMPETSVPMRRVLLADDSVAARKSIQKVLEMAGVEVVSVGNGDLALKRLDEVLPQMVLLDVIMPGRNGYEVCAEIKAHAVYGALPVLLVSGDFEPFDDAEAKRCGADGHLIKPFDSQAIAVIQSVWARYAALAVAASAPPAEPPSLLPPIETGPISYANADGSSTDGIDVYSTTIVPIPDFGDSAVPPEPVGDAGHTRLAAPGEVVARTDAGTPSVSDVPAPAIALDIALLPSLGARTTEALVASTAEHAARSMADPRSEGDVIRSASTAELRLVYGVCPACRAPLVPGDVFCLACGAAVFVTAREAEVLQEIAARLRCGDCSGALVPGDVFCISCGSAI